MEYEPVIKFSVFILADTHAQSYNGRVYGLTKATHEDFDSYDDASGWITNEGQRQTEYVIMEFFRKP